MGLFEHDSYRSYLKQVLEKMPKRGRGELSKIAKHLGVHSTLMSLILSGDRDLTLEQTYDLAEYLKLTELEADYFTLLVQYSRAGNQRYKTHLKEKINFLKKEAQKLSHRFTHETVLTSEQQSVFYSSWLYSAVRLFTSTSEIGKTIDEVSERFSLQRQETFKILQFLSSTGLVIADKDRYKFGIQRTFLPQGSPHLLKHHSNWRIKAIQKSDQLSPNELMFTSPISLSKSDFLLLREEIAELLKKASQVVKDSPAEDIACLNVDFFWIDR